MVGENIKKIRESKSMGLNKTAGIAKISGSYLSNIEKGIKDNPSIEVLKRIANALNVQVEEFFKDYATKENLNLAMGSMLKINEMAKDTFLYETNEVYKSNKDLKPDSLTTIAAHFEGEKFTENEKEDIENFIKFVLSKKKK